MKLAVLPFNAAQGTRPALGRQFSNFAADTVRSATGVEINAVSFLAQMEAEDGPRAAFVNVADTLMDLEWIAQMFTQSDVERIMDGLLKQDGETYEITVRFHEKGGDKPLRERTETFSGTGLFEQLRKLVEEVAEMGGATLPAEVGGGNLDFGTENAAAFLSFLEGYDALQYIQQANGRVATEFSPKPAMDSLIFAAKDDPDFLAPYETLIQFCRLCSQFRIGTFEWVEEALLELTRIAPNDFKAFFALGEAYQGVNNSAKAAELYEKAITLEPNEAALYTRLGLAQMQMNMPANAERNFRKALELEGEDKPSLDFLAGVLFQTNRAHEVPPLWKDVVDKYPQNAAARAKYAASLHQAGNEQTSADEFEKGLNEIEDNLIIKRFYAPMLAAKGELDRAMDMYEDCIDTAPNDVQLLTEYAQTLAKAKREFEIPKVLKDILASNPEPNTRAQTLAWLTEIEQPKRAQAVEEANKKFELGDFAGTVRDLKPMRNWLADYWKLWALLAASYNKLGEAADAQDAAQRLINLFPGFEPAYLELSQSLGMQGKHDEAYNMMRWAAGNNPQSLGIHIGLAIAANRAGHQEEAHDLKRQILEAAAGNTDVVQALAEIS